MFLLVRLCLCEVEGDCFVLMFAKCAGSPCVCMFCPPSPPSSLVRLIPMKELSLLRASIFCPR